MVDERLKELKKHGDILFPVKSYDLCGMEDDPSMILECHWHDEWEFFTIFEGCANFIVNGKKYFLKEGDMIFMTGGILHMAEAYQDIPCRYRAIVFGSSMLYGINSDIVQSKYIEPLGKTDIYIPYDDHIYEIFDKIFSLMKTKPPVYEMMVKAGLYELLAEILGGFIQTEYSETQEYNSSYIKNSINYMNEHFAEEISIPKLAKMANMSTGYFINIFKKSTSLTPVNYLMRIRLLKAAEKLSDANIPISEVAADCGFNSQPYFTRLFKKKFSLTPGEYRKNSMFQDQ